jgi:hypothetical protein
MGVRVRLSRKSSAYFPFWVAIPVWLAVVAVWAVIGTVWLLVKLVFLAAAGIDTLMASGSKERARRRLEAWQNSPPGIAQWEAEEDRIAAERAAAQAAEADRLSRGRHGRVTERVMDAVSGGYFVITDNDGGTVRVEVGPGLAARDFASVRKGDIAEVTVRADGSGVGTFRHISRANGSVPRYPAGQGMCGGEVFCQ